MLLAICHLNARQNDSLISVTLVEDLSMFIGLYFPFVAFKFSSILSPKVYLPNKNIYAKTNLSNAFHKLPEEGIKIPSAFNTQEHFSLKL